MYLYNKKGVLGVLGALITELVFVVRQLAIFLAQRVARNVNSSLVPKVSDKNPVKWL